MAVGAPPQLPGAEGAAGRPAVAFALVGEDASAAERHRHGQPSAVVATTGVACDCTHADQESGRSRAAVR